MLACLGSPVARCVVLWTTSKNKEGGNWGEHFNLNRTLATVQSNRGMLWFGDRVRVHGIVANRIPVPFR